MAEEKNMLVIGLLLIIILGLGYMAFSKPTEQNFNVGPTLPEKDTVSVSGEAKATVSPDRGIVDFIVETNKSTAKLAQSANAEIVSRIKQALLQEGVNEKSIETTSFSVQPVYQTKYDCPDGTDKGNYYYECVYTQEIIGYKTTHQIRVKVENIDKTGDVADRITEEGGDEARINSISFDLRDETRNQLEMQLLQQASTNAKNKAQRIATGFGVELGKVVMASENVYFPPVYDYRKNYVLEAGVTNEAAPTTEVFQGQIEVTAKVSASFEIGG